MTQVPQNLKYTDDHEWVRAEADGSVTIGVTDHAQHQLGELVYVELPDAGRKFSRGDAMAVVESTKAASDVYAPLAGVDFPRDSDLQFRGGGLRHDTTSGGAGRPRKRPRILAPGRGPTLVT